MPFSLIHFVLISGMLFLATTPIQSENIQTNQSFSSSQIQDQKLASTTSSSSSQKVNCTPTNLPTSTEKLQTYTNPNYPNLKINYDNSWKIETESSLYRNYEELCQGKITLSKNNSKLTFELKPEIPVGCDPLHDEKVYSLNSKIERVYSFDVDPSDHNKIIEPNPNQYYYRKVVSTDNCWGDSSLKLKTNVIYNELSDKDKVLNSPKRDLLVKNGFLYYVAYTSLNSSNPTEILQADEIIKNSVLE